MTDPLNTPNDMPANPPVPSSDPASPAPAPDPAVLSLRERVLQATWPEKGIYGGLAELPPDAMLEIEALAGLTGLSTKTIERMVERHDLPPPIFFGRRIWRAGDVIEHINSATKQAAILAEREAEKLRERERRCLPPGSRRRLAVLTPGGV